MSPSRDRIRALTSLSPSAHSAMAQRAALQSWANADLEIHSFNHPSERDAIAATYGVDVVPVDRTTAHLFGRHYIPIKAMLEWAERSHGPVLIINADIVLRLARWELQRLRWASDGGLCCFVRHNHDGDFRRAVREQYGIDAFLFSGGDGGLFPDCELSMGQPFWDFWLPHVFASAGRRLAWVDFPAAFHQRHPIGWSWDLWHRCGLDFARVTGVRLDKDDFQACQSMAISVRQAFDRQRVTLAREPRPIRDWVERTFRHPGRKTFLELGAHCGSDTLWLSRIPGVSMHAFEPDPRNHPPQLPNVIVHRAAIAEADGRAPFLLSESGWGREWTYSSSLRRPKSHLQRYPVTFGDSIVVDTIALDSFTSQAGLAAIDFVWADVQGAEGEMVLGGLETFRRTRYLYTAYSDDESYEGQPTLRELLALLPDFRVVELWPEEVLFENRAITRTP
ncbi:MAG TPA: FkbM family methyltransferase [Vicinamibacterales bacterium]